MANSNILYLKRIKLPISILIILDKEIYTPEKYKRPTNIMINNCFVVLLSQQDEWRDSLEDDIFSFYANKYLCLELKCKWLFKS